MFYAATAILVAGLVYRIRLFAKSPAPLKIPTTPGPTTKSGVALRLFREVVFFESLFKGNKWTWIFGYAFHFGLFLVLLRHLRYFIEPVWSWVAFLQPFGVYAGFAMAAALAGLAARRVAVARVRYISTPSDYLMLVLLLAIALTGLAMKYVAHTDVVAVKAFCLGLVWFDWQPLPADGLVYAQLALVALLGTAEPALHNVERERASLEGFDVSRLVLLTIAARCGADRFSRPGARPRPLRLR